MEHVEYLQSWLVDGEHYSSVGGCQSIQMSQELSGRSRVQSWTSNAESELGGMMYASLCFCMYTMFTLAYTVTLAAGCNLIYTKGMWIPRIPLFGVADHDNNITGPLSHSTDQYPDWEALR